MSNSMTTYIDCTTEEKLEAFGKALANESTSSERVVDLKTVAIKANLIEATALLVALSELFYAEEGADNMIVLKSGDPLLIKVADFAAKVSA